MITRYEFKNYRALKDVKLDLTPMHVLIGPNGSGKSTILEAIRVISALQSSDTNTVFPRTIHAQSLLWGSDPSGMIELAAEFKSNTAFRYSLALAMKDRGELEIESEHYGQKQIDSDAQFQMQGIGHGRRYTRKVQTYRGEAKPVRAIEDIANVIRSVALCRWIPQLLAQPVAFGRELYFPSAPTGFGLVQAILDLQAHDNDNFVRLQDDLKGLFSDVSQIKLKREDGYEHPQLDRLGQAEMGIGFELHFAFRNIKEAIPASRVSEGMLLVLGYLVLLHSPDPPRMILIEEPENAVHPRRLAEIVKILRKVVDTHKSTQILMTTHSPYLVDHFAPEEVTLCQLDSEGAVELHRFSESEEIRQNAKTFTLGEIWMGAGEDRIAAPSSPKSAK